MRRISLALWVVLGLIAITGAPASAREVAIDFILVEKGARALHLMRDGTPVRSYRVALGRNPEGPKRRQGDGRTPEGLYRIDWRNPDSRFHLSLHISYPGPEDVAEARRLGVPPGGDIMIHGLPNGVSPELAARDHPRLDWTEGCIALTNAEIEELWALVPNGTPIRIDP